MTKQQARSKCLRILKKHNRYVFDKLTIQKLLTTLSNKRYKNILLYVNLPFEVSTKQLIVTLRQQKKQIFVPFMQELSFKMVKYSLPLVKKKFNIYEPKNKTKTKHKIDIAVVPIIGIDKNFRRIGFGKGMYDRFFSSLKYKPEIIFTQIYPCIINDNVTQTHDIQANLYISYKIFMRRGSRDGNRSISRLGNFGYSRIFCSQKNR
ncbi:MAG: 5-formyltetrahydrofolate cyclo-ligase [Epsilonproteobacteria bacterium]|nr:5-formyltetrahydrofolate cyclo-ligase [Campylobacterota bacterium]